MCLLIDSYKHGLAGVLYSKVLRSVDLSLITVDGISDLLVKTC